MKTTSRLLLLIIGFVIFYITVVFALSSIRFERLTLLQLLTADKVDPGGWGHSLLRFREIQNIKNINILIVGSSKAYRGYDPRIFKAQNYTAFNMGSTSQTPMNTYFLLKQYLPKIKPKVIVFDLDITDMAMDGYESILDLSANVPISWELLEMSFATGNPHAVTNVLGKLIRDKKWPLASVHQQKMKNEKYISGGYVETMMPDEWVPDDNIKKIKIFDSQLGYTSKILDLAKTFNITIVEVIQPLNDSLLRSIPNYKRIANRLRNSAMKRNVIFIDFNNTMHLNHFDDYQDEFHLNQKGVFKYNKQLLDTLIANKTLLSRDVAPKAPQGEVTAGVPRSSSLLET
jgi:hypothetical protein